MDSLTQFVGQKRPRESCPLCDKKEKNVTRIEFPCRLGLDSSYVVSHFVEIKNKFPELHLNSQVNPLSSDSANRTPFWLAAAQSWGVLGTGD